MQHFSRTSKRCALMVKCRKQAGVVGVLEFEGWTSEAPEVSAVLAEHKARKGGRVRVGQSGT